MQNSKYFDNPNEKYGCNYGDNHTSWAKRDASPHSFWFLAGFIYTVFILMSIFLLLILIDAMHNHLHPDK
jgi:hypothetical protein